MSVARFLTPATDSHDSRNCLNLDLSSSSRAGQLAQCLMDATNSHFKVLRRSLQNIKNISILFSNHADSLEILEKRTNVLVLFNPCRPRQREMSWAEEDWTVGLSGRVLQKVKELQVHQERLSRENKQKQLQLDNIHTSLEKQTTKV